MNRDETIARWKKERPQYEAWGKYIKRYIAQKIDERKNVLIENFCESVPMRTKELESLWGKMEGDDGAKENAKPKEYEEINDKVGVRFIVFVESDIDVIIAAIEAGDGHVWEYEEKQYAKDKRINEPNKFKYTGYHYIIRNKEDFPCGDINVPKGIACEVQIRTVFQHAASSFSHHYAYKKGYCSSEFEREIARMVALAEIVDEWYAKVAKKIGSLDDPGNRAYGALEKYYKKNVCPNIAYEKSAMDILRYFEANDDLQNLQQRIEDFFGKRPHIICAIKRKRENHRLFRHPVILLVYLMVSSLEYPKDILPVMTESLKSVYDDLGKEFEED